MAKKQNNPGSFTDHPRKRVFREKWAKELLKLTHRKLNQKLVYLGLPGIAALDIKAWIEFLERVIAFQCEDYDGQGEERKKEIEQLLEILNGFEASNKIKSYQLYQGYIEDVVIRGIDTKGAYYNQGNFVTVYNLDFCNTLGSPSKVVDEHGKIHVYYKMDVIKKLLEVQKELDAIHGNKFIMFLTVNSNFMEAQLDGVKENHIDSYRKKLRGKKDAVKNVRLLKAYAHYHISKSFNEHDFNVEFLPPILYRGSAYPNEKKGGKLEDHWMLTFTILGTRIQEGNNIEEQDVASFLDNKFIFANDTAISCFTDPEIQETDYKPDVAKLFTESRTYSALWQ